MSGLQVQGTASSPPSTARTSLPEIAGRDRQELGGRIAESRGASARRQGSEAKAGTEDASERIHACVRKRPEGPNARIGVMAACVGGGEGGIRTRDALPRTAFPVRRHSPLGDLSPASPRDETTGRRSAGRLHDESWRRGRDSNPRCFRTPLFESGTINHSDTSPRERIPKDARPAAGRDRPSATAQRAATGE